MTEATFTARERVGAKAVRMEMGYVPTTAPDFAQRLAQYEQFLKWAWDHNIDVMLCVGGGGPQR